jgi:tape measure domain-containing protein
MLNDVAAVENRMQALSFQVQELNRIPVDLRTDQTNQDLESLREKLSRALSVQETLNQAMGRMDISAANAAYGQLDLVMASVEKETRDIINAQNQLNHSIRDGTNAASGLVSKLKGLAAGAGMAFSAKKVMELSDSVSQTTARLNLMNDGMQSTEELNQMIFASAQRARAPYLDTANAIAKLGLNAGNAFRDNKELIAFTEAVNQQFAIGGASAQEQSNAMTQLTQAMAAGALRGQDLNSILSAAPGIARAIEKSMGWAEGSIKSYAEKGEVTAEVVKASLLNMAEETNEAFESMPVTFSQAMTNIGNDVLQTFTPLIETISEGATIIHDNWSVLEPIFYDLVAGISAATVAWGVYTTAAWLAIGANRQLLAGMLSDPLLWIVVVVGAIVAAIHHWVQSVGGLRVAWLLCVDGVLTAAGLLKLTFLGLWHGLMGGLLDMAFAFESFRVKVVDTFGNLKVKVLTIVQDLVNGAIDRINRLFEIANRIPGISFDLIGHVEFATNAKIAEQTRQQERAAGLVQNREMLDGSKTGLKAEYDRAAAAASSAWSKRQAAIEAAKADAAARAAEDDSGPGPGPDIPEINKNTGKTAGNTAAMADAMDVMDEELKYMRDAAEQEVINRFTLAELKIDLTNHNTLKTETDFDRMNEMLNSLTDELLSTAAEGDHL